MKKQAPPPLAPITWPTWLGLGLLWALARLPARAGHGLGRALGALAYHLARERREVARRNLQVCFPYLDAAQRNELLRASFRSLGIGAFEFIQAWWGPLRALPQQSRFEGVEHLRRVLDSGRGVILLSGHFMTLEICGRLLCAHVPIAGMYRPHRNSVLEWAVRRGRLRYAATMFARDELRACVRHLKRGGVLWYAPDQDMRGKQAVFAPFFGVPAATITATHELARLSGAAVMGFFHRRCPEGPGYEIRVTEPLADFPGVDPIADAACVNRLIEAMVREAPDEYLWIHRRFKTRPAGERPVYD